MTTGKQKTQKEDSEEENTHLLCTDGVLTQNTENPSGIMDGQRNIVDTWTTLQLLISHTLQHGQKEQGITTCSF